MKKYSILLLCALMLSGLLAACMPNPDEKPALTPAPSEPSISQTIPQSPVPQPTQDVQKDRETPPPARTFLAYLKLDNSLDTTDNESRLALLADEVLWIDGNDEAALEKYGIPLDSVANDYALYNEAEEWLSFDANEKTTITVEYELPEYDLNPHEVNLTEFKAYMNEMGMDGILVKVTVTDVLISIEEVYTP